jgi:single-stranded DNA-binding protein
MASSNVCIFIGRVGTDPEQHESQDGVQVSRFRLAIDAPSKEQETCRTGQSVCEKGSVGTGDW